MRKINGEDVYHYQKNDALVEVAQDNVFRAITKMTMKATGEALKTLKELRGEIALYASCFPTSFADGTESCGWPNFLPEPLQKVIQVSDFIMCVMNNPHLAKAFRAIRPVPQEWGYNEIPDYYPLLGWMLWGKEVCRYKKDHRITFDEYCGLIDHGHCVCFPERAGHVTVAKGYDIVNGKKFIIYNDPFLKPKMVIPARTLGWGVVILPYEG